MSYGVKFVSRLKLQLQLLSDFHTATLTTMQVLSDKTNRLIFCWLNF